MLYHQTSARHLLTVRSPMQANGSPGIQFSATIERPEFILKYSASSPFAEFVIRDGVLYDESLARETRRILQEADPAKKYILLVHCEGFFRVTKKVRKLGAKASFSSHLAAVAFFTDNSSLALLGELYNKINKPAVPTRMFSSREAAEDWLMSISSEIQMA